MKKLMLSIAFAGLGILTFAQEEITEVAKENVDVVDPQVVAQTDGSILIEGDNREESISLNGETLIVKGNNIVVHAAGNADKIIVEGDGVQVVVDSTNTIEIKGSKSYVYYREGEPKSNVSKDSAVQKIDS